MPEIQQTFIDLSGPISSALAGIGEAIGGAITGTEKFGDAILKVVAGFAKQLGQILIATGVAMLAAKKLITNPYTAIIAGIALVALASAASSAISSAHKGSFGGGGAGGGTSTSNVSRVSPITETGQRIQFDVNMVAQGTELRAVLKNTESRSQVTG